MEYASFSKRFAAYGWDTLVVLGLALLVSVTPTYAQPAQDIQALVDAGLLPPGTTGENLLQTTLGMFSGTITFNDVLMPIVLSAVYNIVFVAGEWQGTPGKHWCGIKIVNADGSKLTLWQATLRHVASAVSVIPCYLGFLTILFTKEKTALHDMICNTRVVRVTS